MELNPRGAIQEAIRDLLKNGEWRTLRYVALSIRHLIRPERAVGAWRRHHGLPASGKSPRTVTLERKVEVGRYIIVSDLARRMSDIERSGGRSDRMEVRLKPNSAKARRSKKRTALNIEKPHAVKDSRITTVLIQGKPAGRAWDFSELSDESIRELRRLRRIKMFEAAALYPVKPGRPPHRKRLEQTQRRLDQGWKPWRIACEEAGAGATSSEIRAAYSRVLNRIKHHKLKPRVVPPDAKKSPTTT